MTNIEEQILRNQMAIMQTLEKCLVMNDYWQIQLNTQAFNTAKLIQDENLQQYYGKVGN